MNHLLASLALLAAGPSDDASPVPADIVVTPPDELVTPGTLGFLVTFAVAVALYFLVRDMNRRVQRIQVRGERADAARAGEGTGPVTPGGAAGAAGAVGTDAADVADDGLERDG